MSRTPNHERLPEWTAFDSNRRATTIFEDAPRGPDWDARLALGAL